MQTKDNTALPKLVARLQHQCEPLKGRTLAREATSSTTLRMLLLVVSRTARTGCPTLRATPPLRKLTLRPSSSNSWLAFSMASSVTGISACHCLLARSTSSEAFSAATAAFSVARVALSRFWQGIMVHSNTVSATVYRQARQAKARPALTSWVGAARQQVQNPTDDRTLQGQHLYGVSTHCGLLLLTSRKGRRYRRKAVMAVPRHMRVVHTSSSAAHQAPNSVTWGDCWGTAACCGIAWKQAP